MKYDDYKELGSESAVKVSIVVVAVLYKGESKDLTGFHNNY